MKDVERKKILVGKPETKELVKMEMAKYEHNIEMNFKEFGS